MSLHINDGGTWKTAEFWLNDQGTWKRPQVWVNDLGTWKIVETPTTAVSISPVSRSESTTNTSFTFASCVVTVTGGTATSYTWGFTNAAGGTWTVNSGQGGAAASARVTGALDTATADFYCDVVVGGQTFRVSSSHEYIRAV